MVVPKKPSGGAKKKESVEKSATSASPEPFKEPDGMTTIDLNKSDDYSEETQAEIAKQRQKAQIRYVARLLFALGSILFLIVSFMTLTFLNKEYHLFTVNPLKINQPAITPTLSSTEDLVNFTKSLNQALFKERLKSGNYLEDSFDEMNNCKLEQTVDACCDIFGDTDLYELAEYCTVNDMLNILLEFEMDRRKKRQVYDHTYQQNEFNPDQYIYRDANFDNQFLTNGPKNEMHLGQMNNFKNAMNVNPANGDIFFDEPQVHELERHIQKGSPQVQSLFEMPLSERTKEQILDHITIAPKAEKKYVFQDFHHEQARFTENNAEGFDPIRETSSIHNLKVEANGHFHFPETSGLSREDGHLGNNQFIGFEPRQGEINKAPNVENQALPLEHNKGHFQQHPVFGIVGMDREGISHLESIQHQGSLDATKNVQSRPGYGTVDINKQFPQEEIDHLTNTHRQSSMDVNKDLQSKFPFKTSDIKPNHVQNDQRLFNGKQEAANDKTFLRSNIAATIPNKERLMVGIPQKKPLVSIHGDKVNMRKNITIETDNEGRIIPVNLNVAVKGSDGTAGINIAPNVKINKNKDELEVTTQVLPGSTDGRSSDDEIFNLLEEERIINKNAGNVLEINPSRVNKANDLMIEDTQKSPLTTHFESSMTVHKNHTTESTTDAKLKPANDIEELTTKRVLTADIKLTKEKHNPEVTTSKLIFGSNNKLEVTTKKLVESVSEGLDLEKNMSRKSDNLDITLNDIENIFSLMGINIRDLELNLIKDLTTDIIMIEESDNSEITSSKSEENLDVTTKSSDEFNASNKYRLDKAIEITTQILPASNADTTEEKEKNMTNNNDNSSEENKSSQGGINDSNNENSALVLGNSQKKLSESIQNPNHQTSKLLANPNIARNSLERANPGEDDFRPKTKQFTGSEDVNSNQHAFVNPCFNPYMNPYVPFLPSPVKVGSAQGGNYLKIVSVSQPKVQNQPMYVLNPAMYYGIPPNLQSSLPSFVPSPYYPPLSQNPVGVSQNAPVQVASSGGQYYVCNPIPTPSNSITGLAGVEVRRDAANLQNLLVENNDFIINNKSREASLICPLGEQACLDNSKCIRNHHICDDEVNCDDSSDEIACSCKERVGKMRLCDGYCDCPRCEDEQGCFGCEETEYSCDDWSRFRRSTCIPISQRCDGIKQCEVTGKDEMDCSILADHIGIFPLNKISNSVGFLHRNYKGKWYPTCFGTELWAAEVCQVEAGPSAVIPKAHMTLTTDPYDGLFINILPNNEVSLVNTCVQDRAAFVECPPIYCGLRFLINNPYRAQEVDTSIEDMLTDLERAYKLREDHLERNALESSDDFSQSTKSKNENDELLNRRNAANAANKGQPEFRSREGLTQEHLEEVIEKLEKTFSRREVSDKDRFSENLKESRVVGGKPSQPASWPWLVSIYKNGIFHCGGVLINEFWVVTASHCVDRYWQYYYEIQAGALRRFSYAPMDQRRFAKVIIAHEFYSKSNLRNDIALMKLSAPVRYNRYVRPICLPSETTAGQDFLKGPTPGTICTTVGWGATIEHGTDPDHMREVEVPILEHCRHKEDSDVEEICAGLSEGGKDACQGDSGGPLMCRNPNNPNQWYLAGIVSHGEGCARPNEPGVYTKVSKYIGWITENTREDKFTITNPLHKCPGYVCKGTKRCITKKRRCDRIIDCLFGDDEIDCESRFKELFKHSRKNLIRTQSANDVVNNMVANLMPIENFGLVGSSLNSTTEKQFETDEVMASMEGERDSESDRNITKSFNQMYFKCKTLLQIIPIEKLCNKVTDCEDGTDELQCKCSDYVKTIDPTAICDGVTDCSDMSDESQCVQCNQTEYTCRFSQTCIDLSKRCDGVSDCPQFEDETECVSLTNGQNLTLDKDTRPMLKIKGIVTINHQGLWKPLCMNNSSTFDHKEPSLSTIICIMLGFDDYFSYHKYRIEDKPLNSSYSMISGRLSLGTQSKQCQNCCDGLYVTCSNKSTSSTTQLKSLEQENEIYTSPWMAAIYANGQYKCMGTLLNDKWIVTSSKCFKGIDSLELHYTVAILGKGKLHLTVKGPHEQVIRISRSFIINSTDVILLRLENVVKFNRYVQAASLDARRDGLRKEKCYAVGQSNENKTMFLPLAPLKQCLVGYRCFEKKIEENCKDNRSWSGTIICDSRVGWYPAAVFHEEDGHCGISHSKRYTSVKFYKNVLFDIMKYTPKIIPAPLCPGFQCYLGNCISKDKICDGIEDCHNGEDEKSTLCYEKENQCHFADNCVCPPTHLKCPATNKCIPKSSFCDRNNDCGDFEDEPDVCSCRNYLKLTNPSKICDGTVNCMDRSDEDPEICTCKLGDFQCGKLNKCIAQEMVCDGTKDCPYGEDENVCLSLKTDADERNNAGEVMTRTAGVWHAGCFDLNYSATKLEEICSKIGFKDSSASQLPAPHNLTTLSTLRPTLDSFDVVWLRRQPGNKMKLRLRSGQEPYLKFVTDKKCQRLFIACI